MTEGESQNDGRHPEPPWPPRFDNSFLAWSAAVVLGLFLAISGWFRTVYSEAGLFEGQQAAAQTASYVLVIVGLLMVLGGLLFALVEATKPPGVNSGPLERFDVPGMVSKVMEAASGKKTSTVLFSFGFVLLVLAAAGSGLVSISVGNGDAGGVDNGAQTEPAPEDGS